MRSIETEAEGGVYFGGPCVARTVQNPRLTSTMPPLRLGSAIWFVSLSAVCRAVRGKVPVAADRLTAALIIQRQASEAVGAWSRRVPKIL
jgi:hypothetical protein